jgi:hypothetical protein
VAQDYHIALPLGLDPERGGCVTAKSLDTRCAHNSGARLQEHLILTDK